MYENIAGFGGDSSKITIFGQSSGGVAADWWTFAYKDNPIVNSIISESGNAFSFGMNSHHNVPTTVGCNSSVDVIECVRGKDWEDILAAASRLPAAPGGNPVRLTPPFYPTVDNETVFSGYASLLKQGKFARIVRPLNIHNTRNHDQITNTDSPSPNFSATTTMSQVTTLFWPLVVG